METLTIDRDRWLRGVDASHESRLKRPRDGKMCCLGFESLRRGFTEEDILDASSPEEIGGITEDTWDGLVSEIGMNTELCSRMMMVNDDPVIFDDERESQLIKDFAELGVQVTFIGDNKNNILELE